MSKISCGTLLEHFFHWPVASLMCRIVCSRKTQYFSIFLLVFAILLWGVTFSKFQTFTEQLSKVDYRDSSVKNMPKNYIFCSYNVYLVLSTNTFCNN